MALSWQEGEHPLAPAPGGRPALPPPPQPHRTPACGALPRPTSPPRGQAQGLTSWLDTRWLCLRQAIEVFPGLRQETLGSLDLCR